MKATLHEGFYRNFVQLRCVRIPYKPRSISASNAAGRAETHPIVCKRDTAYTATTWAVPDPGYTRKMTMRKAANPGRDVVVGLYDCFQNGGKLCRDPFHTLNVCTSNWRTISMRRLPVKFPRQVVGRSRWFRGTLQLSGLDRATDKPASGSCRENMTLNKKQLL